MTTRERRRALPGLLLASLALFAATSTDDEAIIRSLEFFSVMDVMEMPAQDARLFLAASSTAASEDALAIYLEAGSSKKDKVDHE